MRRGATFGAVCLTVIAVLAALLGVFYHRPEDRRALWVAAGIALVVQLAAFAAVHLGARKRNVIVGWAVGIGIRFAAFIVWASVGVSQLGLPQGAALLSMASYLFVTTLIEPLFLKT
jgi:hypothetical membrane protein